MKKITLTHISRADKESVYVNNKLHRVSLGNGHHELFTNIRDAKRYINDANRFLNFKLAELNQLYVALYAEYRNIWFYLNGNGHYLALERTILNYFSQTDDGFNLAVERAGFENGNYFVFSHLEKSCNNLANIADCIKEVHSDRVNSAEYNRVEILRLRVLFNLKSLQDYGHKKEEECIKEEISYPHLKISAG